jgi:hypothetical protein
MQITNNHGLPESFMRFLRNDKYSRGDADISVTTLIDSPRINKLRQRHVNDMTTDVTDRIWALLGTAVHQVLESTESPDTVHEERMYATIANCRLSGAIDVQKYEPDGSITLMDYKVCSAWSVMNDKPEWERQLNCYAWLITRNKERPVNRLQVCAILRDWNRRKGAMEQAYPDAPVQVVDVPVWSYQEQEDYIVSRIVAHQDAQERFDFEDPLPLCSNEERWIRPGKIAVMKKNRKSAVKLFDDVREAELFIKEKGSNELFIEERPTEYTRCSGNFCGVAQFCDQYRGDDNAKH